MLQLSKRNCLQILLLLGFIGGVGFLASATEPVPPTTGLVEPTIRIAAGANDGSAEVNFRSAHIQPSAPRLEDSPLPIAAATVKFFPVEGSANTPSNTWRYRVEVTGLGTMGVTQQRYAKVTYANQTIETFSYMLSNQATTTFAWTISKPPDPWVGSNIPWGSACTSFFVTPKDSAATDVRVTAALIEQSTKRAITSDKLKLCKGRDQCEGDERIELLANVPAELVLCTTETFYGNFTGSINLIAREKPEGEAILLKGHFSSFVAKSLGFVSILIGVFIAWLAKVYARARLERNQTLLPAIEMRRQVEALQKKLNSLNKEYAALCVNIREQITALLEQLSTSELDKKHLIPPKLPNPFSRTLDNTAYKKYLESLNPGIQTLSILIKDGVESAAAAAATKGSLPDDKKRNVTIAVQDIDKIASTSPLPTPADALSQIQSILTKLQHQLTGVSPQPQPLTAAHELKTINLEIESISKGIWILYSLLTATAGLLVLILYNPGFGTPSDYVFAFFWGFALPATVQSIVPGSVATALDISIAKA
jgi:hypothetical protein